MTEIRDYADYSAEKLRAAFDLFSSPTLDALGDVDVNGITVDADMRAAILAAAHSRALEMNARRAGPTGRPFDYLTDRSLFDTIERVLSLPIGGQQLAAEWLTALVTECHVRALEENARHTMTATEKGKALAASQPTDTLLGSLAGLDRVIDMAHAVNDHEQARVLTLLHAWIVEALEVRYPAAAQIMADRFDAADPNEDIDYATELRLAVEKVR
jgi:hypothetical protein